MLNKVLGFLIFGILVLSIVFNFCQRGDIKTLRSELDRANGGLRQRVTECNELRVSLDREKAKNAPFVSVQNVADMLEGVRRAQDFVGKGLVVSPLHDALETFVEADVQAHPREGIKHEEQVSEVRDLVKMRAEKKFNKWIAEDKKVKLPQP